MARNRRTRKTRQPTKWNGEFDVEGGLVQLSMTSCAVHGLPISNLADGRYRGKLRAEGGRAVVDSCLRAPRLIGDPRSVRMARKVAAERAHALAGQFEDFTTPAQAWAMLAAYANGTDHPEQSDPSYDDVIAVVTACVAR